MRKPPAPPPRPRYPAYPAAAPSSSSPTFTLPGPAAAHRDAVERGYRRLVELAAQDDAERQRDVRVLKVITGDPSRPYIALTFDDGPHGDRTLRLLDLLRSLRVPATFFLVGMQAVKYPAIVQRIVLEGHELGNHSFHHYRLPRIPLEEVAEELDAARDVLHQIVGVRTRLVRPPGGDYDAPVQRVIERGGYVNVLWSADPSDYKPGRTPAQIEAFSLRDMTPGGILLLHDGVSATWDALPRIVSRLRARGLIFVTVSDLIHRGGGLLRLREIKASRTSARP